MNKLAVIIASYERPRLLAQTIESMFKNADTVPELVVIDCFSQDPGVGEYISQNNNLIDKYFRYPFRAPIHTVKNKGYLMATRSEYLYFSDNDMYFEPHWDTRLIKVLEAKPEIGIVGGLHHPHHQIDGTEIIDNQAIVYSNEQPGYSMMMRMKDFKVIGPWFSDVPVGGEDSNLCRMTELAGFKIAALATPAVLHCGASGSHGNPAADRPQILEWSANRKDVYVE